MIPKIIVIIPIYNASKYIEYAVQSVINQKFENIEMILVDDGSTDESLELSLALKERYHRITVITQENSGVSSARNTGLRKISENDCKNCYVAFLDADDAWCKNWIDENIIKLMERGLDLIGCKSCYANEKMTFYKSPDSLEIGEFKGGGEVMWKHAKQHFGAMLYKAEFLQRNNILFDERCHYSEDKYFSLECMYCAERIALVDVISYLYRQSKASLMHNRPYGIKYYDPIINGYIGLSNRLLNVSKEKSAQIGFTMAKLYLYELVKESIVNRIHENELNNYLNNDEKICNVLNPMFPEIEHEIKSIICESHSLKGKIKILNSRLSQLLKSNGLMKSLYYAFEEMKYKNRIN